MINPNEKKHLTGLLYKRQSVLIKLIEPSRASANAMKDAGMHRTADPLLQALFEIDAVDQEIQAFIGTNPGAFVEILLDGLGGKS